MKFCEIVPNNSVTKKTNITVKVLFSVPVLWLSFFRVYFIVFVNKTENTPANMPTNTGIHKSLNCKVMGARLENKSGLTPNSSEKKFTEIIEKHTQVPATISSMGDNL